MVGEVSMCAYSTITYELRNNCYYQTSTTIDGSKAAIASKNIGKHDECSSHQRTEIYCWQQPTAKLLEEVSWWWLTTPTALRVSGGAVCILCGHCNVRGVEDGRCKFA